ncbi:MAG TPA: hypothetical protein DCR43_01565 [Bacteroidales bacterium]|nr:MAG: hypothetical protein A2X11_10685 [Bacteroidetes bacterium GWE2_42_24]OFY28143.1 MAG: hypothetical protein A2X09_00940 [Bacteroidetes bacterium GWF2_43_11]PKP23788.1 MAG: hypothetical protein CVU06_06455 [Bacteroidetes bacterium HGW-Bacteroidetes-22]HAQ64537.1 hypothetical protein [Bacteroidales bacterium]HBZ65526.1 hypothetical protein [Bacteroidales bacterium]
MIVLSFWLFGLLILKIFLAQEIHINNTKTSKINKIRRQIALPIRLYEPQGLIQEDGGRQHGILQTG